MPNISVLRDLADHPEARTMAKYVAVGILSVALNFLAFLLSLRFGAGYFAAGVIGYATGLINSFAMGYVFVFPQKTNAAKRPFALVVLVFLLVYGAGGLMMGFGVDYGVEGLGLPSTLAWLVVAAFVVAWNYLGSKFIVFRSAS